MRHPLDRSRPERHGSWPVEAAERVLVVRVLRRWTAQTARPTFPMVVQASPADEHG